MFEIYFESGTSISSVLSSFLEDVLPSSSFGGLCLFIPRLELLFPAVKSIVFTVLNFGFLQELQLNFTNFDLLFVLVVDETSEFVSSFSLKIRCTNIRHAKFAKWSQRAHC